MKLKLFGATVMIALCAAGFAGEISLADTGSFDVTSVTSFGVDLDNTYRYGLDQELTKFQLVLNLVPYQKLSNRVVSPGAVGFIDFTLFHLDLMTSESLGYNAGVPDQNDAYLRRNRFQTGEFVAGIANGNWIFQMNAGANEPFWSPWNKGLQFVNDKVKFTWAYLDSMVDVVRTRTVSEYFNQESWGDVAVVSPTNPVVTQFQQDNPGASDGLGLNIGGPTIGAMYNKEGVFGLSLKFATEYSYDQRDAITEDNRNGLAAGVDFVTTPASIPGLKIFASIGGANQYGPDKNPDPVMGGSTVGYTINLNDSITLEPFTGVDVKKFVGDDAGDTAVEFEVSGGLTMRWPGQGGWYTDYILEKDGRVFPGMSLCYKVMGDSEMDTGSYGQAIKFTLFEPRGDEGVFYGVGSEIIIDFMNIATDDRELLSTVYVDYEIPGFLKGPGTLVPWTTVCHDNLPGSGAERENGLKIDAGVKLRNAIPNTIFGVAWNSGDLLNENVTYRYGYGKISVEIRY